jgi:hypothetical protein
MQPTFDPAIGKRDHRVEKDLHALTEQHEEVFRQLRHLQSGVDGFEKNLHSLTEQHEEVFRQLRHLQSGIDGLVRAAYIDASSLPYPERLTASRFRLLSQNQEDGILWSLFQQIGTTSKTFVELGSGATGGNAAMLAGEFGWTGLLVEGDQGKVEYAGRRFPRAKAVCAWITPETVNDLLTQHGFAREVDLLSVDVDGVDYWVWKAITVCSARLVMLEYNSMFGADKAVTVPYDPKFDRRNHRFCYYGASLPAMTQLSASKGYRLVAVEPTGVNAFFLRNDVAPEIPACDPARVYRIPDKYNELIREKQLDVFKWARETGRELVEVG